MTPLLSIRSRLTSSRAFAALLAFGLAAAFTKTADGYALEGPKWPNGSNPTVQLELGSAGRTLSDGTTSWNAAVSPAVDMWNQVVGSIQLGRVMNSTAAISQGDRLNSLSFGSTYFGHSFGSNTLAVTSYSYSGSTMLEGDIVFNTAWTWDSYRGGLQSAIDIQRVALHELGHLIGLAHSSVSGAIMYPSVNNSYLLTADDISGIQSLYGAPSSSPTPTPTPSPTPTATPTATPSATVTPTPTPTPGSGPAVITSPAPGSTFGSSSVTFSWTAGGATSYALVAGSSFNGSDIYNSGITNAHSATVTRMPTDGRTIYVSLYSNVKGSWVANQYTYRAFSASATPTPTPTATPTPSPTPTSTPSTSPVVTVLATPASIRSTQTSTFTISTSVPAGAPVTVRYTMGGTAILGKNYSLSGTPNQVTIPAGASSASVSLSVLTVGDAGKTATMSLTSGSGYTVSAPSSASVFMKR